ncbi:MAG: right-handed parallel beta-helix repeat-containing protein, partial [Limisphaerales bacterium]
PLELEGVIHLSATDAFGNTSELSPTRLVYSVNTTRDGANTQLDGLNHTGTGNDRSLRAALEDARTASVRDPETTAAIHFRIPGPVGGELLANPQLALDASPLPEIRFFGELGTAPDPEIVQRLSGLPSAVPGRFATNPRATITSVHTNGPIAALRINSSQRFHLERLTFGGFPGGGLLVDSCEQVVIHDCQVEGTGSADPLGNIPGILVQDSPGNPGSIVLSKVNLITNVGDGLSVTVKEAATRIRVEECQVLDNRRNGIVVEGIGKERLDVRVLNNLVGGHAFNGIELRNASGVVLTGNRVGLETELRPRPNQFSGVVLRGVSEFNEIGGTTPGSANLVGANVNAGLALIGPEVRFNQIHGNTIGDPFADGAFGNDTGILIQEARDNHIGRPGAGNDILRNRNAGITLRGLDGTFAEENRIAANRFLANDVGVLLERARNNLVGAGFAQGPEDGNEFLPGHGAAIRVLQGTNNWFLGNRMAGNVKAIELLNGSHGGLQSPRIIGTEHDGQTLRIDMGESTGLSGQITYEVFLNPGPVLSVREFCERADRFLGRVTVTGDGIPGRRTLNLPVGQFPETSIAVTATVDNVGTSPLSNCHPIITFDSDGDGASDQVEETLAAGSSDDPLRSAVPGFPADGGDPVFTPIRIESANPTERVQFRSTVGGRMDQALVPPPPNVEFPLGFFGFVVEVSQPGDAVTLRLGPLPADLTRINCLFKLARKTPEGAPEWFCLQDAFFDPVSREWVFALRDGFLGDFDLLLDSLIVDPIAPAFDPALPPLQSGPRLGIVRTPAGALLLRLGGATPGRRYQWQQSARLDDPNAWTNFGDVTTAEADGVAEFTDTPGDAPRFYRVLELP